MLFAHKQNSSRLSLAARLTMPIVYFLLSGISPAHAQLPPQQAVDTSSLPVTVISATDADNIPLPFYKIAADTYFLYGNIAEVDDKNRGFNGNAGFIVTSAGVVVIDSLGTPRLGKRLIATVRKVSKLPIKYLILTHNHPDHSYGAIAFKKLGGIKIIGHEGTLQYLASENLQGSVTFRRNLLGPDMKGFEGVKPDILVGGKRSDHYTFTLGGKTFAVYNTGQHHSYGDLVVNQVEDHILWISDLAFNNRSTFMGDGNSAEILETMDWLRLSFPDTRLMIPGHGSAQTAPFPMVEKTYTYVKRLRDEMSAAIKAGQNLESHKKNANFVYLEMEQELF